MARVSAAMIEVSNSRRLQKELEEFMASTRGAVVLDLSSTSFISSTGAGVLAYLIRLTKDQGRPLRLISPHEAVRQLFKVTRFLSFEHVRLTATVEEALASLP